jgi:hypothetical protein
MNRPRGTRRQPRRARTVAVPPPRSRVPCAASSFPSTRWWPTAARPAPTSAGIAGTRRRAPTAGPPASPGRVKWARHSRPRRRNRNPSHPECPPRGSAAPPTSSSGLTAPAQRGASAPSRRASSASRAVSGWIHQAQGAGRGYHCSFWIKGFKIPGPGGAPPAGARPGMSVGGPMVWLEGEEDSHVRGNRPHPPAEPRPHPPAEPRPHPPAAAPGRTPGRAQRRLAYRHLIYIHLSAILLV